MEKKIFLFTMLLICFSVVTFAQQKPTTNNNSNSKVKQTEINSDKKFTSSRALEIHYMAITDTTSEYIIIDNKKYKWYDTREEAIDDFMNAFMKRDLTVVYVNTKKDEKHAENPEYFEITE
ncbi:MAG: hypothetical protein ABII90_14790 [Bacteroidota bacterium]